MKYAEKLCLLLLLCSVFCHAGNAGETKNLRPALPEELMLLPDAEKQIVLNVKGGNGEPVAWQLADYAGNPLPHKGTAVPEDGKITLALKLPRGFYELHFPDCGQRIGIAVSPRQTEDDPYWGVNAHFQLKAPAWESRRKHRNYMEGAFDRIEMFESYCRILHDAGIRQCREFTGFLFRSKQEGSMNYNIQWAEEIGGLYRKYQLRGLFNYNLFPDYVGTEQSKKAQPGALPRLAHVRYFDVLEKPFKYMLEKEAAVAGGLQIYNEDDMTSHKTPHDMVSSLDWAVRYWLKELNYSYPLVGSGICGIGIEGMFPSSLWRLYRDSGYLECIDAFAMHYYFSAEKFRKALEYNLAMLTQNAEPPYPAMWITECNNWFWIGGLRSPVKEDKNMANITVRNAVHARACGVERFYVFCLTFMDEAATGKNFGMFDFYQTPHRLWSAYATAAAELRNSRYIGDLEPVPGFDPIHVFEKDGGRIAVLSSSEEPQVNWREFPAESMLHIDGAAAAADTVTLYGGIGYLKLKDSAGINADTTAAEFGRKFAQKRGKREKTYPVVLRHHFEDFDRNMESYLVPDRKFTVNVTAFNLSDQARVIRPVLSLNGRELPEQKAEIPAHGKTELSWVLETGDDKRVDVTLRDAEGNASPLAMRYRRAGEAWEPLSGAADPANWRVNCLGNRMTIARDEAENAVCFRADMSGHNVRFRWFFPQYNFPEGQNLGHATELLLDLKPGEGSEKAAVYVLQKEPPYKYGERLELVEELPDGWKTYRLKLLFPEEITALQFGYAINPEQAEFRIRNVRIK